jgi:thiol-disulfide isomerase/thioredoxin
MANGVRTAGVVAAMAASITLLLWAGVHNGRQRRLEMQQAQEHAASQVTLVPDSATQSESVTPKLQGKVAPAFTLVDLDGKKVSLADYKGKPVLVNFWATWCGPCKLEMPWFQEFGQKYGSQGLVILGLAADDAGKTVIADTAKKSGVTDPILLADDKVEEAYGGVDYLPETFYVDRSGKVMLETAGISSEDGGKDEIEANIKKLVASGQ